MLSPKSPALLPNLPLSFLSDEPDLLSLPEPDWLPEVLELPDIEELLVWLLISEDEPKLWPELLLLSCEDEDFVEALGLLELLLLVVLE